jgi:membrane-bound lytic murein transglycosylase D
MARGYGLLTVSLALLAGFSIGSNPLIAKLPGLGWLASAPTPAERKEPKVEPAVTPSPQPNTTAEAELAPEARELAAAEAELFGPQHWSLPAGDFLDGLHPPDVPIARDGRIGRYLQFFTQAERGRAIFESWLSRRADFAPLFSDVFRQERLPYALEAVAFVESGLHPRARSHAGAAGLWQLMPATARAYGLKVDSALDERYEPALATRAAAAHLVDLFLQLRDWDLALAAYNAGSTNIEKRLDRLATRSFWHLANAPDGLPSETRLYVPKVLAIAILLRNLSAFGFEDAGSPQDTPWRPWLLPKGERSPHLSQLLAAFARGSDAPFDPLESLKPRQSHAYLIALGDSDAASLHQTPAPAATFETYRVAPGDTLISIAESLGLSTEELTNWNKIKDPKALRIGQLLRVHPRAQSEGATVTVYLVSDGETLSAIARRFGVEEAELVRQNRLSDAGSLREGQILKVRVPSGRARSAVSLPNP